MNLYQFQIESQRTCVDLDEKLHLCHMLLGMYTEMEEYKNAIEKDDHVNAREEIGDALWFLANYCRVRDIDLLSVWDSVIYTSYTLLTSLNELSDIIKGYIAYNKEIDTFEEKRILRCICYNYKKLLGEYYVDDILERNINKLRVRFPQAFDTEKALNRDLESERKELSKGLE